MKKKAQKNGKRIKIELQRLRKSLPKKKLIRWLNIRTILIMQKQNIEKLFHILF